MADISFQKKYVNTQYNRDASDKHEFILKEIFGIEQKPDETDDVYFQNLKQKAQESLVVYMDTKMQEWNKNIKPTEGWEWVKGCCEIENISRVS